MKNMDNNKFRKYFDIILEQDAPAADETPADQATPEDDQAALEQGLDTDTKPEDFDVEPENLGIQTGVVKKLNEYITKIEEFSAFLNDPNKSDSLNKYINEVDKEGSVLKGISRETSKVTTVAENLASLAEAFRGQLLVAMRKYREKQAATEEF